VSNRKPLRFSCAFTRPKETITNSKQTMQYLIIIHHFNGKSCSKVPSNSFYFISKKFSSKKIALRV